MMVLFISYLLGSIPSGLILSKWAGEGDIRQIGSGNIGATNVLRTGNKRVAFLTLFSDLLKGIIAVYIAYQTSMSEYMPYYCAFACVLGHVFPVWLKFRGGKGVATALGTWAALSPSLFIVTILLWGGMAKMTGISSLSALIGFLCAPFFALYVLQSGPLVGLGISVYILLLYTHRQNIVRLMRGEEGSFKKRS